MAWARGGGDADVEDRAEARLGAVGLDVLDPHRRPGLADALGPGGKVAAGVETVGRQGAEVRVCCRTVTSTSSSASTAGVQGGCRRGDPNT
jgi:hypothetical protein